MTDNRRYTWYIFIKVMENDFHLSVSWVQDRIVLYRESMKLVSIAKKNNMSYELVKELLEKIDIDIEDFEKNYQNAKNSEFR